MLLGIEARREGWSPRACDARASGLPNSGSRVCRVNSQMFGAQNFIVHTHTHTHAHTRIYTHSFLREHPMNKCPFTDKSSSLSSSLHMHSRLACSRWDSALCMFIHLFNSHNSPVRNFVFCPGFCNATARGRAAGSSQNHSLSGSLAQSPRKLPLSPAGLLLPVSLWTCLFLERTDSFPAQSQAHPSNAAHP